MDLSALIGFARNIHFQPESRHDFALNERTDARLIQDHVHDVVRAGTETFQGAKVDVYTGLLEGKYINQVVSATGMDGMLSEVTGGDETALDTAELGDIPVTSTSTATAIRCTTLWIWPKP